MYIIASHMYKVHPHPKLDTNDETRERDGEIKPDQMPSAVRS